MGYNHIQVAMRNTQWMYMGGYLHYIYIFLNGHYLAKTYCFLHSIGQLAMPNFFLSNICLQCYQQKNKEKTWGKLYVCRLTLDLPLPHYLITSLPPITWHSDITRQILKRTQCKQIFSVLYHIDCLSKYLLE